VLGYFFGVITAFTAVVALAIGLFNVTAAVNGPHHYSRPVIARTVTTPPVKEASPARGVSSVVSTAKADTKKASITNPKWSPVSTTTMPLGTHWVTLKNLGTAQKVPFSTNPAHG